MVAQWAEASSTSWLQAVLMLPIDRSGNNSLSLGSYHLFMKNAYLEELIETPFF
jgi:hypothetical protein